MIKIYQSKRNKSNFFQVIQTDDPENIFMTQDGVNSIPNPGLFVLQQGGVENVLNRCIDWEGTLDTYKAYRKSLMPKAKRKRVKKVKVIPAVKVEF